jgi:hypothetical protein
MKTISNDRILIASQMKDMKEEIEKIESENLIEEAITLAESRLKEQSTINKKEEILEKHKTSTIKNYLASIKGKSVKEIVKDFENKINEYNKGVEVIIEKIKVEKKQLEDECKSLNENKKNLINQIATLNRENTELKIQLQSDVDQISKLQTKFIIFEKNKKLFDDFMKEFPTDNPTDIMKDLKVRKEAALINLKDYTEVKNELYLLKKEKNDVENRLNHQIKELNLRNYDFEKEKKKMEDNYQIQLNDALFELAAYKQYRIENDYLKNMLFHLYNLLFETFRLDKNLKIKDKFLNIKETDFKANIFSNPEIESYIKLMIHSMHQDSILKVLRETSAYANMMIRNYLPEKVNIRFKPIEIFREIKLLVENKDEKIKKLESEIKMNKEKYRMIEKENLITSSKLKNEQRKFEKYQKIVDKVVTRQNKGNENNTMTQSLNNPKMKNEFNKTSTEGNRKKNEKIQIKSRDNEKVISIDEKDEFFSDSESLIDELRESSILSPEENQEFRRIKTSKNKDRLQKIHGCQNMVNNLNNLKNLVDHTNRLFMYKSKMGSLPPKINKFDTVIEDRFLSNETTVNSYKNNFSKDKIVSKLDKLIASIDLSK